MKKFSVHTVFKGVGVVCLALLPIISFGMKQPPSDIITQIADLKPIQTSAFDELLIADNTELKQYKRFYINQPTVTFDKRWLRDYRTQIDETYKKRITRDYSNELIKQLTQTITKQGFEIVDQKGEGVLTIQTHLVDLRINGPDYSAFVKQFVTEAGNVTLKTEFIDANNTIIAQINDYRQTRERGVGEPERTSRVQNHRDFKILMSLWSKDIFKSLSTL